MLIAKGSHVRLHLEGGRSISPSGMLLHDESGRDFPSKRCLITAISKTKTPLRKNKWFGPTYTPLLGGLSIPGTRAELLKKDSWDDVGEISKIEYDRVGEHEAGYKHSFVAPKPLLLRRGRVYCIVLRGATKMNWRGFVERGQ
jgi:hypothetical protein